MKRIGTMNSEVSKREQINMEIVRKIASQGMVLLENHDCLPLTGPPGKVALFGNGARRTVKGGSGSGDVNVRSYVTVEQGLVNAGFEVITKSWLDEYDQIITVAQNEYDKKMRDMAKEGPQKALLFMMENPFQEPAVRTLKEEEVKTYKANTAIYVIARNSGEGADRLLQEGEYLLRKQEVEDITLIATTYEKVIILLNVGGVIDLSPLQEIQGIGALLLMSQGGSSTGDAVGDVLTGKVTPSGKLASTWAKQYSDYPSSDEFSYMNGDLDDSYYREGIYVGYRYFDSFNKRPLYPFGYGKSYTNFDIKVISTRIDKEFVRLNVQVENSGSSFSGKEVVQVYYSAPEELLEKPYQELIAYKKTKELKPGESVIIEIPFLIRDMASYCEKKAAYILERGDYLIRVGNSSRNTKVVAVLSLAQEKITEQCKNLFGDADLQLLSRKGYESYGYSEEENEIQNAVRLPVDCSEITTKRNVYQEERPELKTSEKTKKITLKDVIDRKATLEELVSQLTVKELAEFCVGAARMQMKDFSIIGNAADTIPGAAGETTSILQKERAIPRLTMADGPAGLRMNSKYYEKDGKILRNLKEDPIFSLILPPAALEEEHSDATVYYQYCTALPIATLLAQTWDMELIKMAGDLIGGEMEEMGITLWLAPGMDIHRNPLCGRNFEYYSEDPLVSGYCAATVTEGVQSHPGIGTTIKHLAANNQENNRCYNNSHVNERTLREVYLKGFEICVKQSKPMAAMTALNLINGIHAANNYDLLTAALRDEWGFQGFVMTDWGATSDFGAGKEKKKYKCSDTVGCIKAGNDLVMPGSQIDVDRLMQSLKGDYNDVESTLSIADLQWCAMNILKIVKDNLTRPTNS